ncbi:hypothetical protein V6N13_093831 [Hibiscus sabdariffa]|uniref:Uncharacterized protein n=1 Tax=Hibiscus sabdariffa TaxID=183260 RepID=A0ABR2NKQ8_9ROSI
MVYLHKRIEVKLQELSCCVLHNICKMMNEEMELERKFKLFDDEVIPENNLRSMASAQTRDHIAHNLLHHGFGLSIFFTTVHGEIKGKKRTFSFSIFYFKLN